MSNSYTIQVLLPDAVPHVTVMHVDSIESAIEHAMLRVGRRVNGKNLLIDGTIAWWIDSEAMEDTGTVGAKFHITPNGNRFERFYAKDCIAAFPTT